MRSPQRPPPGGFRLLNPISPQVSLFLEMYRSLDKSIANQKYAFLCYQVEVLHTRPGVCSALGLFITKTK